MSFDFRPYSDGSKDVAAALNAAMARGETVLNVPPGDYRLDVPLVLPSRTNITADPATRFFAGDANRASAVVVNSDTEKGNKNITISGGIWDGCAATHKRTSYKDPDYAGRFFHFINVRDLCCTDMHIRDGACYQVSLGRVTDFRFERIVFDGKVHPMCQDGVHIGGGCERGVVRNIRAIDGATGDDLIALNADDVNHYSHNAGQQDLPIRKILVEDVQAASCWTAVRVLSIKSEISDVVLRGFKVGYRRHGINADAARYCADPIFNEAEHPNGVGALRNVLFEDFELWYAGDRPKRSETVTWETNGKGVRFRNFHVVRGREKPTDKPVPPAFRIRKVGPTRVVADGVESVLQPGEELLLKANSYRSVNIGDLD